MIFSKLDVKNFKSISEMHLSLNDSNYIVGANSSGKTNFLCLLKFIQDYLINGLNYAIEKNGGVDNIFNANYGAEKVLSIDFELLFKHKKWVRRFSDSNFRYTIKRISNRIIIEGKIKKINIVNEYLKIDFDISKKDDPNALKKEFSFEVENNENNLKIIYDNKDINDEMENEFAKLEKDLKEYIEFFKYGYSDDKNSLNQNLIHKFDSLIPPIVFEKESIKFFNFDPNEIRKPSYLEDRMYLKPNGENVSSFLDKVLSNKKDKNSFLKLLSNYLPFIKSIDKRNNFDNSISFSINEIYSNKDYYPVSISDGTINIIAILLALYFDKSTIVFIEEPERNIHPALLNKITEAITDISTTKQVFITTHSCEVLKHLNINDLIFVRRDASGNSCFSKPVDSEMVDAFLKNDIGIDDLFLSGALR